MHEELIKLDALEFIRPIDPRGLNALRVDHGRSLDDQGRGPDDFDLKRYVEITEEGREYLALRTQLTARSAESPSDQVRS